MTLKMVKEELHNASTDLHSKFIIIARIVDIDMKKGQRLKIILSDGSGILEVVKLSGSGDGKQLAGLVGSYVKMFVQIVKSSDGLQCVTHNHHLVENFNELTKHMANVMLSFDRKQWLLH